MTDLRAYQVEGQVIHRRGPITVQTGVSFARVDQVTDITEKKGVGDLKDLIYTPDCWEVG